MTTLPTTNEPTIELSPRAKLEILGAILLALFLFALDQTVVGTALPVIVTDLNGNSLYTWVVTIYLLTATISGPIYGRLSDLFGRRPIIIFAVSLFLIGSVLCGLSQQMWQLILFRGIQGLGGGAIFPVSLAVVADLYTPAERGKYLGLFGAVFGLSSLLGPAIGGIITDTVGWHWIFFVNVPLGLDLAGHHLAPPPGDPSAGRRAQHRLRRRGGLRPGHHALPDRAHQQADRRVGRSRGRWPDPGRAGDRRRLPVDRVAGSGSHRAPGPVPDPELLGLGRRDVPGGVRVLRRDHLPAALVPDRRRCQRDRIRLQHPAAPVRPDLQRDRLRPDRRPHGPLQGADARIAAAPGAWPVHAHPPDRRDRPPGALVLDADHRSGHRAILRGLHARRPELGGCRPDRGGHWEPDVLPADRRDDRADPRRHGPRQPARDRDPDPAGRGGRAPADRRRVRGWHRAWTSPGRAISVNGSWPPCRPRRKP